MYKAILFSAFAYTLLCNYDYGYHNEGGGYSVQKTPGDVRQTWVANSASWFNDPPFFSEKFDEPIFKIFPNLS